MKVKRFAPSRPNTKPAAGKAYLSILGAISIGVLALAVRSSQTGPALQAAAQNGPVITNSPVRLADGWRINWRSTPGNTYILQRWHSENLGEPGDPSWINVSTVEATAEISFAEDGTAEQRQRRYYRVVELSAAPVLDNTGPVLGGFRADLLGLTAESSVRLSVSATDQSGVSGVEFLADNTVLPGVHLEDGRWVLEVNYVLLQGATRLTARATDARGNASVSSIAPPVLASEGSRFAALDGEGNPIPGSSVEPGRGVPLPAVEFRPATSFAGSPEQTLVVKLAAGATIEESNGREVLRFTEAELRFGRDSSLQFGSMPAVQAQGFRAQAQTDEDGTVRIVSQTPLELPTGPLSAADLEQVLNLEPGEGVPILVFGTLPLRWHSGVLEDAGIRGARFSFPGLPLPALSGDYPNFVARLDARTEFKVPFYGEFEYPDGTLQPPVVRVSATDPAWLILRADGSIGYHNRSEFNLPFGGKFRADVKFDDPVYHIQIFADAVQVPMLGSLAQLIPSDPALCIPIGAEVADLNLGTRCLTAFEQAVYHFAASAAATTPISTNENATVPAAPPDDVDTALSILDAWSHVVATPLITAIPMETLHELLHGTGEAAQTAGDLESVVKHRKALARALLALQQSNLATTAETETQLQNALAAAEAAALLRMRDPNAVNSLRSVRETLRAMVETQELFAQANGPQSVGLHESIAPLLQMFLDTEMRALEVQPAQFTYIADSPIGRMNRFVVFQTLSDLLTLLADAAALGVDDEIDLPFTEATTQMALRLWTLLEAAFNEAEAARDIPGYQFALEDLLDLEALRQMALFPERPELNVIAGINTPAFQTIVTRLGQLYQEELARPYPDRSLVNETTQLRRLIRILREVPATVTFAAEPFERAYGRMNEKLAEAMGRLSTISSSAELLAILEGGIVNETLRRQFNLVSPEDWDTARLPAVVARLAVVAQEQKGWSELHGAFGLLRAEANRIGPTGDQARRKLYLQQSVPILVSARATAMAMWESERVRRELTSVLNIADLLLPGDIRINKVAGSARFNTRNGHFGGSFKGEMLLPKFNGRLNVLNASFGTEGEFELSAFGGFTFQNVSLAVPQRQPLTVSFKAPKDFRMDGEAILTIANGMSFAARLWLEDPIYGFRIEARDLRLELAKRLTVFKPVVDTAQLAAAGTVLREAYMDYYSSLSGSLEAIAGTAVEMPELNTTELGEIPEYESPQLTIPFSQLGAFANSILLDVERGINRSYAFATEDVRAAIVTMRDEAALAAQTLTAEGRFLENQIARLAQQRRQAEAVKKAGEAGLLSEEEFAELIGEAKLSVRQEALLHTKYLQGNPPSNLADVLRHGGVLLDIGSTAATLDASLEDLDGDGIPNAIDLCPGVPQTAGQPHADPDGDGIGSECDPAPSESGIPGTGPCADYIRLAGQPVQQMQALLACQLPREYAAAGIDFATGNITNQAVFDSLTSADLELKTLLLIQLAAVAESAGIDRGPIENLVATTRRRLVQLKTLQLLSMGPTNALTRFELALQIAEIQTWTDEVAPEDVRSALLAAVPELQNMSNADLERLNREAAESKKKRLKELHRELARELGTETTGAIELLEKAKKRGVVGDTLALLKVLFGDDAVASTVYRARIDAYIRYKIQKLKEELVEPDFLQSRIGEAEVIAEALADFTGWVAEFIPEDSTLVEELRAAWNDLTLRFTVVAETKRAWWLLRRYETLLHEAVRDYESKLSSAFSASLRQDFAASTLASSRVLDALALAAESVDAEAVTFKLPGDLRVRRAFGGIEYNRTNEVWTGTFGGRIEFPDLQKAFFEIGHATIATDGTFSIAAATGGPLPFGELRVETSLNLAGSLVGLETVSGAGRLFVPMNTSTQIYNVDLGYNFGTRQLRFDSTASGLNLRLTDDFVLFNGGVGFDLSLAEPAGALRFNGSAGMFARHKPLPEILSRTNFHLVLTNAAVRFALTETNFSTTLTNGTLLLPEFFRTSLAHTNPIITNFLASPKGTNSVLTNFVNLAGTNMLATNPPPGTFGPSIALNPTNPIVVAVGFDPPSLSFSGELQFRDIGVRVPDFDTLELAVVNARLVFPTNQLPVLTNLYAALQFPLPNQTNIVEVLDGSWALDGFPAGTIQLRTDLDIFDVGGWQLSLLGTQSSLCPTGTGITVSRDTNGVPFLRVNAGAQFTAPIDMFSDQSGDGLSAATCGSLLVPFNDTPLLSVDSLAISNRLVRLGGTNGVALSNMVLRVQGITNMLNPSPERPFQVGLGGDLVVAGSGFGLSNAVFHFEGDLLPRFTVSELSVIQPGAIFGLNEHLPLVLERGRVRFIKDDLPVPSIFSPTNINLVISGSVALPPGPKPVIGGRVNDLSIAFHPTGVPIFSVDAIGFTVDFTELLGDVDGFPITLGGNVYVGGLNNPPNFLFSGKLNGNYKGNAFEVLVALDTCGIRGICMGLAGSELSIPLAYGFVLTGGKGGVSFVNSNADPCDFLTYLPIDRTTGKPTGGSNCNFETPTNCPPAITLEELRAAVALGASAAAQPLPEWQAMAEPGAAAPFPCPGDCPPAAVNIFCMPHPDRDTPGSPYTNRVILKFSAIDESTLNAIGITPESVAALVPQFSVNPKGMVIGLAQTLRGYVDAMTPRPPPDAPPIVQESVAFIEQKLDEFELAFANTLYCAVAEIPSSSAEVATLLYNTIRDAAWAGVACPDVTVMLQGSVSYTGVSTFADVAGGVVLSSTGSAGLVGAVRVFGMPIGTARAFVNQTDDKGLPSPSLCGQVHVGIGPFELGSLGFINDCPGCLDEMLAAFGSLGTILGDVYVYEVMLRAAPALADPGRNALQHLSLLTTPELRINFISAMFQTPPIDSTGRVAPAFVDFVANVANAYQPRISMCGEVNPKLFGFSLSGGNRLYAAKFYAGPKFEGDIQTDKYLMFAEFGFSPSQMMAYSLLSVTGGAGAVGGMLAPALDEATASTTLEFPPLGDLVRDGFAKPPQQIAAERFNEFLANAVTTFNYRLAPLGMELGRASGRILMPSLEHHPRGPSPRVAPELRQQGLPDRLEVLLAALGDKDNENAINRLGDGSWKGEGDADFAAIFAGSSYTNVIQGKSLSLRDDYFPHGGFLGAGTMDLPALLARPFPQSFFSILDGNAPPIDRFAALQEFISNHLLATERVGELSFYLPAPNPPLDRFPTTAEDLIESMKNFVPEDPLSFNTYYPLEQAFMSGWLDTPILGIPTVRSKIAWRPVDGLFRLEAAVPVNSWFNQMIRSANFVIDFRNNTNQVETVAATFTGLSNQVAQLRPTDANFAARLNEIIAPLPQQLAEGLPKVAMELQAEQVRIPVPLYVPTTPLEAGLVVATIDEASVEAYSPFYNREGATGEGPVDKARRDGGFAIRGSLNFLNRTVLVEDAEFSVTPNPAALGLPSINADLASGNLQLFGFDLQAPVGGNAGLRAAATPAGPNVRFESSDTRVRLDATGSISAFDLGPVLRAVPLSGGRINATASFESTTMALPTGSLQISPARLESALFAPGATLRIHGSRATDPFTYQTDAPWSATVSLEGNTPLDLRAAGETVLRIAPSSFPSANIARDERGLVSMSIQLRSGSSFVAFPGRAYQQSFTLNSSATLFINSAGTFSLDAAINDQVSAGATLRGRVMLSNSPRLHFSLGGTLTLPAIGGISIVPRVSGASLEGRLVVEQNQTGQISAGFLVKPARLAFSTVLGVGQSFLIDGGAADRDFTFSTSGPWSARLTLDGATPIELRAANIPVFRVDSDNLTSATIARNFAGTVSISANLAANATLTAFPSRAFSQSIRLRTATALTLASSGSFSLTSTTADALTFTGLPITGLAAGAQLNVTQNGFSLGGTVTGGVLSLAPVSGSVSSTVGIKSSGLNLTGNASVTVGALVYNQFRIAPLSGSTFTASLSNNGLVMPSGLRISYRGTTLGTFNLPSFTIPASANYSFAVGPVNASLGGFNLASVIFTFQRRSGVATIPSFSGNLAVPRPGGTLVSISAQGFLSQNGAYNINGTTSATLSLASLGLPVGTLSSGATATLNQSGLTLRGGVSGGVLSQVEIVGKVTGAMSITANGAASLSGTATVQPITSSVFRIESASGGNMSASLNGNGLTFSGARLRVTGVFGSVVTLPAFTIPSTGNFIRAVNPPNMTIAGFPCTSINFTLRRQNGVMSINPFSADLKIPGFSQKVDGSLSSTGSLVLDYSGSLTMGGFTAANGELHLRNNGLSAEGTFPLRFGAATFGNVGFSGSVSYNSANNTVSYSLGRTSGGIVIGGISIPSPNLSLTTAGATGSASLPFGVLSIPLNSLSIRAGSGLSFNQYNHSVDSTWIRFLDIPFTHGGDIYSRLVGSVAFRSSGGTTFTSSLSYSWAPWLVTCNVFNPSDCNLPPSSINSVTSPPRISGSGSISSSGLFTVNQAFSGIGSFEFDLW